MSSQALEDPLPLQAPAQPISRHPPALHAPRPINALAVQLAEKVPEAEAVALLSLLLRLVARVPAPKLIALLSLWAARLDALFEAKAGANLTIGQRVSRGEHSEFRWNPDELL